MLSSFEEAEWLVGEDRQNVIDALVRLSVSDLMLFWGSSRELISKKNTAWKPVVVWLEDVFSSKRIETNEDASLTEEFREFLKGMSNKKLAIFYAATMLLQSFLLAIAFINGQISAGQAYKAAFVERGAFGATGDMKKLKINAKTALELLQKRLDKENSAKIKKVG